jgi:hypothetical protein
MTQSSSITAGLDLGDRYGQLCLIDAESGEVIEEGRLSTNPKALERRFSGSEPLRVAIEAGTHSPWVSRLLKRCGHEVLVANARKLRLIYGEGRKSMTGSTPRTWPVSPDWIQGCSLRSSTEARPPRLTWRSSARARR